MLETKEQKQIFAGAMVLVLILGIVSFWNHPSLTYQDTADYPVLKVQSDRQQLAYNKYLASLGSDPAAQAELYNEILPPEEVQKEVALALDTSQKIAVPAKPQTAIRMVATSGKAAVTDYFNSTSPIVDKIQNVSDASKSDLFSTSGSMAQVDSLITDLNSVLAQYSKTSVPKEVANFQSNQLIALETYLDLAKTSKAYMAGSNQNPWPQMYKDVAIMSQSSQSANTLN